MRKQTNLDRLEKFLATEKGKTEKLCSALIPDLQKVAKYLVEKHETIQTLGK